MQSHIRKVYACLAVTCHLHFWQNDRDLLRATVVTRGWNGYRNKSQHRKSTLEKKILLPFQQGFEPATFQSRVRRSNHWAIPAPRRTVPHAEPSLKASLICPQCQAIASKLNWGYFISSFILFRRISLIISLSRFMYVFLSTRTIVKTYGPVEAPMIVVREGTDQMDKFDIQRAPNN